VDTFIPFETFVQAYLFFVSAHDNVGQCFFLFPSSPAAFYRLWFLDGFGFSLCENPFGWLLRSKKIVRFKFHSGRVFFNK